MSIDIPVEGLMNMAPGVPPGLFIAVAFVMALHAIRKLWGYVIGFVLFSWAMSHPDVVNSAICIVIQTVTQLMQQH